MLKMILEFYFDLILIDQKCKSIVNLTINLLKYLHFYKLVFDILMMITSAIIGNN